MLANITKNVHKTAHTILLDKKHAFSSNQPVYPVFYACLSTSYKLNDFHERTLRNKIFFLNCIQVRTRIRQRKTIFLIRPHKKKFFFQYRANAIFYEEYKI